MVSIFLKVNAILAHIMMKDCVMIYISTVKYINWVESKNSWVNKNYQSQVYISVYHFTASRDFSLGQVLCCDASAASPMLWCFGGVGAIYQGKRCGKNILSLYIESATNVFVIILKFKEKMFKFRIELFCWIHFFSRNTYIILISLVL